MRQIEYRATYVDNDGKEARTVIRIPATTINAGFRKAFPRALRLCRLTQHLKSLEVVE